MTREMYVKISNDIRNTKHGVAMIVHMDRLITYLTMASYPILLLYLYIYQRNDLYAAILVPAVSFAVVSIYRKFQNKKRPYERYDFLPIIQKETKGKSFPSRHVFSIYMIGMTFFMVSIPLAVLLFVCGVVLGILRVIGGVHDIGDVICGAAIGVLCGWIGYYIIF